MASLKVGIVGTGNVAHLHAKSYDRIEGAEIVAVCDLDEERAIRHALDWNARAYYTDFSELVHDPNVDAIEILTPHCLHAPQVMEALLAGKHVSVERPIALSIEEANQVVQTARRSGRTLHVYEPCLFYKPLLDARSLIDNGEIGKPSNIHIAATLGASQNPVWNVPLIQDADAWRFDPKQSGGAPMLYDVGYQALCIALFLIGTIEKVEVWRAETPLPSRLTLDAPTAAMWKHYQQSCYGTLNFTYSPERTFHTEHQPLEFVITVTGSQGDLRLMRTPESKQSYAPLELRRERQVIAYTQPNDAFEESFFRATRNFVQACRQQESALLGPLEARQLLILTLAYFESSRRGRAVTLQHS